MIAVLAPGAARLHCGNGCHVLSHADLYTSKHLNSAMACPEFRFRGPGIVNQEAGDLVFLDLFWWDLRNSIEKYNHFTLGCLHWVNDQPMPAMNCVELAMARL